MGLRLHLLFKQEMRPTVDLFLINSGLRAVPLARLNARNAQVQSDSMAGMRALELMTEALLALDESTLPADIGAHLDLAIDRLRKRLGLNGSAPEGFAQAIR